MAKLVLLIPDLFSSVRVADTARALQYQPQDVSNAEELVAAARDDTRGIVIDAQARTDWQSAIRTLKADPATAAIPVLVFGPHVDVETSRAALAAGCDRFVTRGAFTRETSKILRELLQNA
jgi:CheY-like chemotaxis protein